MKILTATIDGDHLQQVAEAFGAELQAAIRGVSGLPEIVAISVFDSERTALVRAEFQRRFQRVNVDVEADFHALAAESGRLAAVIEQACRHGLKRAGFELASAPIHPPIHLPVRLRRKGMSGLYYLSVRASENGAPLDAVLQIVRQWMQAVGKVFEDGEVEQSELELQIFLFCPRSRYKRLEALVKREFPDNGIELIDPNERILCQW